MTSSPIELVLARLKGVRRCGNGYKARCPCHDDRRASLTVSEGEDGRALLHCHASCVTEDICRELGLTLKDLFPQAIEKRKSRGRIVATYDYRDGNGTLLFQAVRFDPKDFKQRRPNGNGGWIWNLNGTPRVLYRLPELLRADPGQWVFVVEGEKDCDRLAAAGLVATTCPQGAGKWSSLADDSALNDRRIAVIADKDKAGRAHAADVVRRLRGRARELVVVEVPGDGKDVSDWLDAGGDAAQLLALVASAPTTLQPAVRPQIQGNERQLREVREDALAALEAANDPPRLFRRGNCMVRIALITTNDGAANPQMQALGVDELRGELTNAADWFTLKHLKGGGEVLSSDSPEIVSIPV